MRHDWIFDVLTDLKAYALAHGMVSLAAKTDEALTTARREVAQADAGPPSSGAPPTGNGTSGPKSH